MRTLLFGRILSPVGAEREGGANDETHEMKGQLIRHFTISPSPQTGRSAGVPAGFACSIDEARPISAWPGDHRHSIAQSRRGRRRPGSWVGFTLVELLVTIAIIGILMALIFPALSKAKGKAEKVVCVNNLRQLMIATTLYGADNGDAIVPPGGIVARHRTCWLYPSNMIFLAWNSDEADLQRQIELVKNGLLYGYFKDTKLLLCPPDAKGRGDGQKRTWYLERHVKVSSFIMNGAIAGGHDGDFGVKKPLKMSAYRPDGIVFVEGNERRPGNAFRAGAYDPSYHISQRHDAKEFKGLRGTDVGGGSVCASFDGSAQFVKFKVFTDWAGGDGSAGAKLADNLLPNRVWCYPEGRGGAKSP